MEGSEFERAGAAAHGEASLEQVGRLLVSQIRRRPPEHDRNQAPAVMVGARHDVEPGRTGEACLHAVGAGIAAEKAVVVADDLAAELQRADAEQVGVFGEIVQKRAGDHRHVARRRHMIGDRAGRSD